MAGTDLERHTRLLMAEIKCDVMYDVTAAVTEMIYVYCKWLSLLEGLLKETAMSCDHNVCWVNILFRGPNLTWHKG